MILDYMHSTDVMLIPLTPPLAYADCKFDAVPELTVEEAVESMFADSLAELTCMVREKEPELLFAV